MKKTTIFIAVLFLCQVLVAQPIPRDVLAVQGAPGNSYDWHPEINQMRSNGYQIRDVFSTLYFSIQNTVPINVLNLDLTVNNPTHNYTNVLGLGHDTGGLAIRGLRQANPSVVGQILVGTPNRGSNFLRELNNNAVGELSSIENFVNTIDEWKGKVECPECNKTALLLQYLDGIKGEPYSLGAINDPNGYYALLPAVDHATTAVIWGDAVGQTLGHFLGSRGGVQYTSNVDLQGCADRLRAIAESDIALEEEIRVIELTTGFFANFLSLLGTALTENVTPGQLVSAGSDYVRNQSELLIADIRARRDIAKDIQDLLICELANQRLEAEWIIKVQGRPTGLVDVVVVNPNYNEELCRQNTYQCQYNSYHPDHATFCQNQELYCHETVQQVTFEKHDFVYTQTEQTIPNLPNQFRIEANHLQEQQWERNQDPLMRLFSGNVHPAFHVPKI